MDWTLLGIKPTKDKKEIAAAYRAKLAQTNPEDHPEEFKALRAAYEEALELAKQEEVQPERDTSPVGLWMERVKAVYDCFPDRLSEEKWADLLADDVCVALDQKGTAEETLLAYLMDHYFLPQNIWLLLDGVFGFSSHAAELYEKFPKNFIDFGVLEGIRVPASLPYEYFEPGENAADCDDYRRIYYRINQSDWDQVPALLEQLDALSERHPYGEAVRLRTLCDEGKEDECREGYRLLADAYPEDAVLRMGYAVQLMNASLPEEAEAAARRVLELRPDHYAARSLLCDCLAAQEKYDDAKEIVYRMMDDAGGNQKVVYELGEKIRQWNEITMTRREQRYKEDPSDQYNTRELAWSYLQNDRVEEAANLCDSLSESCDDVYDYHNLCGKVCFSVKRYEEALSHFRRVREIIPTLVPDGTEKTERRLHRTADFLQLEGRCLIELGREEEATEIFERSLAEAPDDPDIVSTMGRLYYSRGEYEKAAGAFETLTRLMPGSYHGYYLLGSAYYHLRRDRDAYEAVTTALDLDGTDLFVYILKMQILMRNGVFDEARQTLQFLRDNGIDHEPNTDWIEGLLAEFDEKDTQKALSIYRDVAAQLEEGNSQAEWVQELYYRLACLSADGIDYKDEDQRNGILELLEKGLAADAKDFDCLEYKAWILKRYGDREEALRIYRSLEQRDSHPVLVERELGELYYRDLQHNAATALTYFERLIETDEDTVSRFYAGHCCRYLGRYAEGEAHFRRLLELDPDDTDGYKGLSVIYEMTGEWEKALECARSMIELGRAASSVSADGYYRASRILRRLERPLDAAAVMDELKKDDPSASVFEEQYGIYVQFGLFKEAEQVLKAWKKAGTDKQTYLQKYIDVRILEGRLGSARRRLFNWWPELDRSDYEDLNETIWHLQGKYRRCLRYWQEKLKQGNDDSRALMNSAFCYFRLGKKAKAKECAEKALETLEKELEGTPRNKALFLSRHSMALALAGRSEDALRELEEVRRLPLCEFCTYCCCKDADSFEADLYEVLGDWEKAYELNVAGHEKWPDETDFLAGIRRTKKKGKRNRK